MSKKPMVDDLGALADIDQRIAFLEDRLEQLYQQTRETAEQELADLRETRAMVAGWAASDPTPLTDTEP